MNQLPDLNDIDLNDIAERYGNEALVDYFLSEFFKLKLRPEELLQVKAALELATNLHRDDKRTNGEPYVNHVVRVATRIIREYKVSDPDIIIAALLHDSIEDHAEDLALDPNLDSSRFSAMGVLAGRFGEQAGMMVARLTNPEYRPGADRAETNAQYVEHIAQLVRSGNFGAILIKLSDFADNATQVLKVEDPKRAFELASKYVQVLEHLRLGLAAIADSLSPEVVTKINNMLNLTEDKLISVLTRSQQ